MARRLKARAGAKVGKAIIKASAKTSSKTRAASAILKRKARKAPCKRTCIAGKSLTCRQPPKSIAAVSDLPVNAEPEEDVVDGERLWDVAKTALIEIKNRRQTTLTIFDWDDTLFPTSAANARDPSSSSGDCINLDESAAAAVLALRSARNLGSVVIVTNASDGWVQQTAERFMPLLATEIQDVLVISAQSIFKPQGFLNAKRWKELCFDRIMKCFQAGPSQGLRSLISIGDSLDEREASLMLASKYSCNVKVFKLREMPSVAQLMYQLEVLASRFSLIVTYEGPLDMDLGAMVANDGILATCTLARQLLAKPVYVSAHKDGDIACRHRPGFWLASSRLGGA